MSSKKARRARSRPVQAPEKAPPPRRTPAVWLVAAGVVALIAAAVLTAIAATRGGGSSHQGSTAGLPDTPDYHSLLVSPADPQKLTLGTHYGLYRSSDGGRTWRAAGLSSSDAMNLVRTKQATLWLAGHYVLKKSSDGGRSWDDVEPAGLPALDVHGFTAKPHSSVLYAAIAGRGLYRSTNDGRSFSTVSTDVGPAVMGLAVTPSGTLFAADMQRGLVASTDGGSSWGVRLGTRAMGVAVSPENPKRILATGDAIYLSTDGGRSFRRVQPMSSGAGPVAWAPRDPRIAYVVGFDRQLYRSADAGVTWSVVG